MIFFPNNSILNFWLKVDYKTVLLNMDLKRNSPITLRKISLS